MSAEAPGDDRELVARLGIHMLTPKDVANGAQLDDVRILMREPTPNGLAVLVRVVVDGINGASRRYPRAVIALVLDSGAVHSISVRARSVPALARALADFLALNERERIEAAERALSRKVNRRSRREESPS